ncbi:hypothetical protein COR50_20530 [Chitinophaga caeni]|uniref:Uncharacterized protein n=1 Tax=Chitinophaga caeni TaxID=2029983 RepID=A0A291QZN2_9BACT|nr:hypothetical protein [Chitinophaga caeni]ATL49371.1 hypothetical protein COR50_20530 [Chitinophaga caeni]
MRVNIDKLSKVIAILLSNLKNSKGNEVELRNDYYWDISSDQIYNPYDDPNEISLGQLSDDLNEVYRLLSSSDEAIPYDLKRIAEILKALSIENSTAF